MNERFYQKAKKDYESIGNREQFSCVPKIVGPSAEDFKGFAGAHNVYRIRC